VRLFSTFQPLFGIQRAHAETEGSDTPSYRVKLAVPAVDEVRVREIISTSGGEALQGASKYEPAPGQKFNSTDPNFSPLIFVVAVLTVDYLAKTIFGLWNDAKFPGLIVDVRDPEAIVVTENQALRRGTVIVIGVDKDKVIEFTPKDEREAGALLEKFLSGSTRVLAR
jgi:hypothetical protein